MLRQTQRRTDTHIIYHVSTQLCIYGLCETCILCLVFPAVDSARVILKCSIDVKKNYINASKIHASIKVNGLIHYYLSILKFKGYKKKNGFIAAQTPLKNTVNQFWQMLLEQGSKALVMLTTTIEKDQVNNLLSNFQLFLKS